MKTRQSKQLGFTLMELLIAIAIVAILAAIAVPTYLSYTKRAYYSSIVQAADQFKTAVSACAQEVGSLTGCSGGSHGIPADITTPSGQIQSVTTSNGVITVAPTTDNDFSPTDDTYVLTPTYSSTTGVSWQVGGGICQPGKSVVTNCSTAGAGS